MWRARTEAAVCAQDERTCAELVSFFERVRWGDCEGAGESMSRLGELSRDPQFGAALGACEPRERR